ncbi:MerR family transcriptional regulator [Rhodopseudomonas palustris]|uniref:MerR family transcriptional regulator n=1 Tax=Rhodopseudomonas palustris TaxID=1076 RepID=UPI000D1B4693|nr:MerR family transcriptional regulator [Rhodopseudomonas palustris]AVT83758.1 hypothetical protein RPYSC3_48980 [Rhodopseudomonas palustris]
MQIGELARRCGVSARMLRYYETEGLLRPGRSPAGYRLYRPADITTVQRITTLQAAGLTLAKIRLLLPCAQPDSGGFRPCPAFRDGIRRRLAEIDGQIAALAASRRLLRAYLEQTPLR